jgi:galactose mutarotase-like enzyme
MSSSLLAPVSLRDEEGLLEATFVPGAGMLCSSLRHHGVELLAQNAGVPAYAERGKTMGIPLLYPWANRLGGFHYSVGGREVAVPHDSARIALDGNGLPIHGVIGGRLQWQLNRGRHHDAQALTAELSWSPSQPALFEVFPFRHDLRYDARLQGGRLEIELTVHACGSDVVPVALGFHPYLSLPGAPREQWLVELPPMRHLQLDAQQLPTGAGQEYPARSFTLAEQTFDDGFDTVVEGARFNVSSAHRRISLELREGYPCAQVYTPTGAQFICFEPMTAPANSLGDGTGLHLLAPGELYRACFSVQIADVGESAVSD